MREVSQEEIETVESHTIQKIDISIEALMEMAGHQVADFIRKEFSREVEFAFICGKGNNGGDGLVAARKLASWGYPVQVHIPYDNVSGLVEKQRKRLENMDENLFSDHLPSSNIYIDALLGYGLEGCPRSPVKEAVEKINEWSAETVSIDLPTGVDCDTGESYSPAVNPDFTVTLALPFKGLRPENAGEIHVADIGIPVQSVGKIGIEPEDYFNDENIILWSESR